MQTYLPLIPVLLMLAAYGARRLTASGGFFHTTAGQAVLSLASGLLTATADAIQSKGLSSAVIVPAVVSFAMSWLAAGNPSLTPDGTNKAAGLKALMPLLLIPSLLVAGCANGLNGVRQGLTDSAKMLTASADTFQRADLAYQRSLEAKPDARAQIEHYRQAVQPKILKAFVDAGAGLSLAQATCAAVEAGAKTKQDLASVMSEIWPLLKAVQDALMKIGQPALVPTSARWRSLPVRVAWDHPLECETRENCREIVWPAGVDEEVL